MIYAQVSDLYHFGSDRIAIRFAARDPDALIPAQYARVVPREHDGAVLEYETPAGPLATTTTISLTDPEARALLETLAAHFGGSGPAKAARDDLLHERQRVDKLTDALIAQSASLAASMRARHHDRPSASD